MTRVRASLAAAWASCGLLAAAQAEGASDRPSAGPGRPPFETILWLHGGPSRDAEFFAAVARHGFTAVSVSIGEDSSVPAAHGLRFYKDQIAGKGILELREAQWQGAWDRFVAHRRTSDLARPACLSDPDVQRELDHRVLSGLDETLPHRPLAISIGDEVSFTSHANPIDFCFDPHSLQGYREFLAGRYGTVERLARDWAVQVDDFAAVTPWTADRIRARELGDTNLPRDLAPWASHREFCDVDLASTVARVVSRIGERAPDVPCGLTGIQPPSAYGGHDYARLLPLFSFYEAYDIGGARDLAQSLAPPDALQVATLFPEASGAPAATTRARVFDMVAHGLGGCVVWSAGEAFDAAARPTAFGRAVHDALRRTRRAAAAFGRARIVRSPVWLVESQASVRAHWMIDSAGDGETWIRRLSSYEATHSTSMAARHSWVRLLEDLGLQGQFVAMDDLERRLARARPRVLVLPACLALSEPAITAIRGYVRDGGTLLADHGASIYDERLRRRPRGGLDEVFGIQGRSLAWDDLWVREGRPRRRARLDSGAAAAEGSLRGRLAEPTGLGTEIQLEARFGTGRAHYLNLAVCEYARVRLDSKRIATARDLRQRVRRILADAGVTAPVEVRGPGWPTCLEVIPLRGRGGRRLLAVRVNALDDPALLAVLGRRGPRPVALTFPQRVRLRDLARDVDLGTGERFEAELDPFGALLLEWGR